MCIRDSICVGQRFVVVALIAEVAFGIRQIVAVPRLAAVQLAALGYGGIPVSYTHLVSDCRGPPS